MKILKFLASALSEKGVPSSKRIMAFIFCMLICGGEMYHIIRHDFELAHLHALLTAILLLAGVATVAQVVELVRGTKSKEKEQE